MLEPHTGVFIGSLSAMVRERLWSKCCQKKRSGGALMIWTTNNEQGYRMMRFGDTRRQIADYDGLQLVREESQSDIIDQKSRKIR
ncbi:MAG: type I-E CRISPR-associated endoribonuclease Cas2e [Candidatus Aminicenantes bacterium]|nr:type I-E CRISPR-associated endoribonuclease Cas2e [Candidatus Aminicenantes bacterium]